MYVREIYNRLYDSPYHLFSKTQAELADKFQVPNQCMKGSEGMRTYCMCNTDICSHHFECAAGT
jgi:hypothetical protein